MLYLSRVMLDGQSRAVQRDLADCRALHRTVMGAFPVASEPVDGAREAFGVLFRVEPMARGEGRAITLLVQSCERPKWERLPEGYLAPEEPKRVDGYYAGLRAGQSVRFRLHANPTRRVAKADDPLRGKGVELQREEEQLAWLARKGEHGGFQLLHARANAEVADARANHGLNVHGYRRDAPEGQRRMTFGSALFEGRLAITDAEAFRQTLATGIGSGKAYGFGLLSIAPA